MRLQGRGPRARARLGCLLLAMAWAWPVAAADPGDAGPPAASEPGAGAERGPAAGRLARVDRDLAEIEQVLATAHFRTVLGLTAATRGRLEALEAEPGAAARRARLEVMAATAELALGQRKRARRSMDRALRADPELALDEARVSPKVVALLRDARRGAGGARPAP